MFWAIDRKNSFATACRRSRASFLVCPGPGAQRRIGGTSRRAYKHRGDRCEVAKVMSGARVGCDPPSGPLILFQGSHRG